MYDFLGPPPKRKAGAQNQRQQPMNPYDYLGPPLTPEGFPRYEFLQDEPAPDPVPPVSREPTEPYGLPAPVPEVTAKVMGLFGPELTRAFLSGRPQIDGVLGRHAMGASPERLAQLRNVPPHSADSSAALEVRHVDSRINPQRRSNASSNPSSDRNNDLIVKVPKPDPSKPIKFPQSEAPVWGHTARDLISHYVPPSLDPNPNNVRQTVLDWARKRVGNKDYQESDENNMVGGWKARLWKHGEGAGKCNIFVGDGYAAAGVDLRDPTNKDVYLTTRIWGNSKSVIPGFRPLKPGEKPVGGDIMSNGHRVGFYDPVDSRHRTISAAVKKYGDRVVHNNWGFRGDEGPMIFWRYDGL